MKKRKKVYMLYFVFANENTIVLGIFDSYDKAKIMKDLISVKPRYHFENLEIEEFELNKLYEIG